MCNYIQNTYLQFSKSKEALLFKFAYISIMRNSTRNKEKCLFYIMHPSNTRSYNLIRKFLIFHHISF